MTTVRLILGIVLLFLSSTNEVFASSDYVLPYPSAMPGSKLYAVHQVWEEVSSFWHFGDYATVAFNREQSDKYLVEAKTLFEYQQYLLAMRAIERSDMYFTKMRSTLLRIDAERNGKGEKVALTKQQAKKHEEVLMQLKHVTPDIFQLA